MENKITNETYEQFKAGMALVEIARFTADHKLALKLTKDGMGMIASASKSYMNDPEDWCPTPPRIPWKGPWPRPNWRELLGDELSKRKFTDIEIAGNLENIRSEISSSAISENLKGLTKVALKNNIY